MHHSHHTVSFAQDASALPVPPALPRLRVGLIGLGTVGGGTYRVLQRNRALIAARTGRDIAVTKVAARNRARAQALVADDADVAVVEDAFALAAHPDIDVVVEAIGGTTVARELVLCAIAHGKHVVTANKALLAEHGEAIFAAAQAQGVVVGYEGAVAVSIPIIKALREGLTANRIEWVAGIINGTTNFILSEMRSKGVSFADALADAQARGFAEADPAFDVEGVDAAHKITLLAANAFGVPVRFDAVHVEGIHTLEQADVGFAERLGYRVKLLGLAKRQGLGLELRVHPTLLADDHLLAQVHGSMNAVLVKSDAAGLTMYYGAGAGAEQTASAVIADLVDVARVAGQAQHDRVPHLAFQPQAVVPLPVAPMADLVCRHYLRLDVADVQQTAARALATLGEAGVQVERMERFTHADGDGASALVVLTLPATQACIAAVAARLERLPGVRGSVRQLRLETLH
jgi:homoserine dehydrogenase